MWCRVVCSKGMEGRPPAKARMPSCRQMLGGLPAVVVVVKSRGVRQAGVGRFKWAGICVRGKGRVLAVGQVVACGRCVGR